MAALDVWAASQSIHAIPATPDTGRYRLRCATRTGLITRNANVAGTAVNAANTSNTAMLIIRGRSSNPHRSWS